MDQVHVVRHKVLVEGRTQRAVARELGLSRVTVQKYLAQAAPVRHEAQPRPRPVWRGGRAADRGAAGGVAAVDGAKQRLTATRLHGLLRAEGHDVGVTLVKAAVAEWKRQRRELADSADVSPWRAGRGRLLRSAGRRRGPAPQSVALCAAADVLGPRLRLDLRAAGSGQLSRRPRARLCASGRRAGAHRVRQSAAGGGPDPGRRRADADARALRRSRRTTFRAVLLSARRGPRQGRRRSARQGHPPAGAGADPRAATTLDDDQRAAAGAARCAPRHAPAMATDARSARALPRSSATCGRSTSPFVAEAATVA